MEWLITTRTIRTVRDTKALLDFYTDGFVFIITAFVHLRFVCPCAFGRCCWFYILRFFSLFNSVYKFSNHVLYKQFSMHFLLSK